MLSVFSGLTLITAVPAWDCLVYLIISILPYHCEEMLQSAAEFQFPKHLPLFQALCMPGCLQIPSS